MSYQTIYCYIQLSHHILSTTYNIINSINSLHNIEYIICARHYIINDIIFYNYIIICFICITVYKYINRYIFICVYTYIYVYTYICVFIWMCMCVYDYLYFFRAASIVYICLIHWFCLCPNMGSFKCLYFYFHHCFPVAHLLRQNCWLAKYIFRSLCCRWLNSCCSLPGTWEKGKYLISMQGVVCVVPELF